MHFLWHVLSLGVDVDIAGGGFFEVVSHQEDRPQSLS